MSRWHNHYKDKLNDKYKRYINKRYGEFIVEIADYVNSRGNRHTNIAELGCGIGSITKAILPLLHNPRVINHELIDNDKDMIKLAWINLHSDSVLNSSVSWSLWDIRNKYPFKNFDVIHSHGVLEHFADYEIYNITKHYKDCAQFHYVPGDKYTTKTMGDERLLSSDHWRYLTGMKVIKFNNGYDYIITNML